METDEKNDVGTEDEEWLCERCQDEEIRAVSIVHP